MVLKMAIKEVFVKLLLHKAHFEKPLKNSHNDYHLIAYLQIMTFSILLWYSHLKDQKVIRPNNLT